MSDISRLYVLLSLLPNGTPVLTYRKVHNAQNAFISLYFVVFYINGTSRNDYVDRLTIFIVAVNFAIVKNLSKFYHFLQLEPVSPFSFVREKQWKWI